MHSYPEHPGGFRPGARLAILGGLLALEFAFAAPVRAGKAENASFGGLVIEFRQICSDLDAARGKLRAGLIDDDEFADRILDLFVRADSLSQLVPRGEWNHENDAEGARTFALSRAVSYLIESLRKNYVGIAARNGVSFVEADQAYQAAVAWRPSLEAAPAPAAR